MHEVFCSRLFRREREEKELWQQLVGPLSFFFAPPPSEHFFSRSFSELSWTLSSAQEKKKMCEFFFLYFFFFFFNLFLSLFLSTPEPSSPLPPRSTLASQTKFSASAKISFGSLVYIVGASLSRIAV